MNSCESTSGPITPVRVEVDEATLARAKERSNIPDYVWDEDHSDLIADPTDPADLLAQHIAFVIAAAAVLLPVLLAWVAVILFAYYAIGDAL